MQKEQNNLTSNPHISRILRSNSSRSHKKHINSGKSLDERRTQRSKISRDCIATAFSQMSLQTEEVVNWNVISKDEHTKNLEKLIECLKHKNSTSKRKSHLKEHDYTTIELLISMDSSKNCIKDQDTHNIWVKQVRFFLRVSQMGLRNALYLENSKPSHKNLVQRQLLRLFEIW